jgi:Tfp pilus assembly ATPase PilU
MVNNNRIAELIRENKVEEISEAIGEGSFFQMQTFTQALIELVLSDQVDREVAADASSNRHDFVVLLDQAIKRRDAELRAAEEAAKKAKEGRGVPSLRVAGAGD